MSPWSKNGLALWVASRCPIVWHRIPIFVGVNALIIIIIIIMDTSPAKDAPKFTISFNEEQWGNLGMIPWFSYTVNLPTLPLPSLSERGPMHTERLIIRPILPSDLSELHRLRRQEETQVHSPSRGRVDDSIEDTRDFIGRLNDDDQSHWYFGAFLKQPNDSAVMVGEGGLPDIVHMLKSGRPESEMLVGSEYWRQGYGSEMFDVIFNSWWDLPRSPRRQQLLPALLPNKEPGDEVVEGIGFIWEESNKAAASFFPKMLTRHGMRMEHSGTVETRDDRPGRVGNLVKWTGGLVENPRSQGRRV